MTTVAAVRYQHVMAYRDAAIARELNRLIEAHERRYGTETARGAASPFPDMEQAGHQT